MSRVNPSSPPLNAHPLTPTLPADRHTTPGGYCEFVEYDLEYTSQDGSWKHGSPLHMVNSEFIRITREMGMEPCPGRFMEQWVKDAGFEDVHATRLPLPMGVWPRDKRLKEVGAWNYLQLTEGIEGLIYYVFTRELGYGKEELDVLCAKVRQQVKDPGLHSMVFL